MTRRMLWLAKPSEHKGLSQSKFLWKHPQHNASFSWRTPTDERHRIQTLRPIILTYLKVARFKEILSQGAFKFGCITLLNAIEPNNLI